MSSSGLIYAVIVGAWAAYLVPMWLRRQDELNEARPTERFSTAIRLLSGRAGMERRCAKAAGNPEDGGEHEGGAADSGDPAAADVSAGSGPASAPVFPAAPSARSPRAADAVDVRALAVPAKVRRRARAEARTDAEDPGRSPSKTPGAADPPGGPAPGGVPAGGARGTAPGRAPAGSSGAAPGGTAPRPERAAVPAGAPGGASSPAGRAAASGARNRRAQVLARRRRTTTVLFLAFTAGAVAAGVFGVAFLWAPAVPGALLTLYIVHLRGQERRRFEVKLDRRRAAEAAQRVREQRASARPRPEPPAPEPPAPREEARAVVEETDHAEWVDGLQRGGVSDGDGWDPVPVPLPTYVTAPVAPRVTGGGSSGPQDTKNPGPVRPAVTPSPAPSEDGAKQQSRGRARRARERGNTPLFDQYDPADRPRAANE